MKTVLKLVAVVAAILVLLLAFNWQKATSLYYTVTMFDADKIVSNFVSMQTLTPTVEVISQSEPHYFESQSRELPANYDYKGQQRSTSDFVTKSQTTSLLVLHDDVITHESYYLGTKPEDRRISWSVAKSFLSAMFGIAVHEGAIKSLDQQVTDYVPELIGSGYDGASIKNVLQMSSGVGFDEDYQDFYSDINRFGRMFALGGSFDDFAKSLKKEREPGTFLHYVSIDTHVLGMVLRKATGESIIDYFNNRLWSKIQPEASTYFIVDSNNEPMVLGGLNMRSIDFIKLGKLFLDNGRWKGQQVVPEQWVQDSITPDAAHLMPGKRDSAETTLGYGYQWWIPENSDGEFMALGIYDQFIYINQTAGVVIVKNSANIDFMQNDYESTDETIALFRSIVKSLD
jgi:CubicO group peptidase (beta-lactamase class C family)